METIGRIVCYGSDKAPAESWHCKKHIGINRLYYIHGGKGGYTHDGKNYPLLAGMLYFIPYTADFVPFCDAGDPIMHTYIDFELIPPIITNDVVFIEAEKTERLSSAASIFIQGGEANKNDHRSLTSIQADPSFWELCEASIVYIVNAIIKENGIEKITDRLVVKALEIMHTRMGDALSVSDMARDCYMTPDSFIRHFCRVVGITPHAYLKNIRLRTARYLRETGMGLTQIANEVGYADASSLLHALRNEGNKAR